MRKRIFTAQKEEETHALRIETTPLKAQACSDGGGKLRSRSNS
jgi:hypothetical protein